MKKRGILGTLIWIVILFLIISGGVFYVILRDKGVIGPQKNNSVNETSLPSYPEEDSSIGVVELSPDMNHSS